LRTLVVGAGAIGQYLTACLKLAGHDAVLWAKPAAAAALASGFTMRVKDAEQRVIAPVAATPDDAALRDSFELAVIAVKSFSTAGAIAAIEAIPACRDCVVLTIQNGLGNEELCATAFGEERVIAGALTTAVEKLPAGGIVAARRGGLTIAPLGSSAQNWLVAGLEMTPIRLDVTNDWRALKWSKLLLNILGNAVCGILDWEPAKVYADTTAFAIERRCLNEAIATMTALGLKPVNLIDAPVALLVRAVRMLPAPVLRVVLAGQVQRGRAGKLPSLLLAARAKRTPVEVDALNGAVAVRAARAGVPAPANAAVTRILNGILAGSIDWDEFRGKPAALAAAIDREAAG
jgi:2-dehydropantoate 2-reductase